MPCPTSSGRYRFTAGARRSAFCMQEPCIPGSRRRMLSRKSDSRRRVLWSGSCRRMLSCGLDSRRCVLWSGSCRRVLSCRSDSCRRILSCGLDSRRCVLWSGSCRRIMSCRLDLRCCVLFCRLDSCRRILSCKSGIRRLATHVPDKWLSLLARTIAHSQSRCQASLAGRM